MRYIILFTIAALLSTTTVSAQHAAPAKVQPAPVAEERVLEQNATTTPANYTIIHRGSGSVKLTADAVVAEAKEPILEITEEDYNRKCVRAENLAQKDNYNKELKFYQFGMPGGNFPHGLKRELLKEKYDLNFIMMGCEPVDSLQCYNRIAERILFEKYGKDFWLKVNEEVDEAANNTGFGPRDGRGRGEETKPSDR